MSQKIPLLVFAKAPIAGKVKTRLIPHCSAEVAAEIAGVLLAHSLLMAQKNWPGSVRLLIAADTDEEKQMLVLWAKRFVIEHGDQVEGSLGVRLHAAFDDWGYPAAAVGADVLIEAPIYQQAHRWLQQNKNVITPAHDGGYGLIGLNSSQAPLFRHHHWGKNTAFSETMRIAKRTDVQLEKTAPCQDVDEWQDVLAASKHIPQLAKLIQNRL